MPFVRISHYKSSLCNSSSNYNVFINLSFLRSGLFAAVCRWRLCRGHIIMPWFQWVVHERVGALSLIWYYRGLSQKARPVLSRNSITAQLKCQAEFHILTHTITLAGDPGPFSQFSWNNRFLKADTLASFTQPFHSAPSGNDLTADAV